MLRDVLSELQHQNSDRSHYLSNQLTYLKKLDTIMKFHPEAIVNLSNILRNNMAQAHERFQQIASDILWLNITFLGQSTVHVLIRQLEVTFLQLVQEVDELLDAVQLAV
jgi:hypothetical protein